MALRRLDAELVRRDIARSREQARTLIESGAVHVNGQVAAKPATQVDPAVAITVVEPADGYVSRGAHKLIGALDAFADLTVAGRDCLDAGASTGGFTQVLLERGAARVLAVDVGYGQLAWSLRTDPRVVVMERTNIRTLTLDDLAFTPDLVVADLSFISLTVVLPALVAVTAPAADFALMVKPQFEVGREHVGDGVIRDPALRASAVASVIDAAAAQGLWLRQVQASPLPGPKGNVEFFVWLVRGDNDRTTPERIEHEIADTAHAIARAIEEGPQ